MTDLDLDGLEKLAKAALAAKGDNARWEALDALEAAANPETVLRLIALARQAQASEGEWGVLEGESVARMRPWWVSWWATPGAFELHRPWWISGERGDGLSSICAAILAPDEFTARISVQWAHDDKDSVIDWRFCEERPKGWSPFGSRFPRADWMLWPDTLSAPNPTKEG